MLLLLPNLQMGGSPVVSSAPDYIYRMNPISGHLDKVVNNASVLKISVDETDPTGGGAAAAGRIPVQLSDGTIKYLAYYDAP